jgi:formate hydrogenlyase subunit 3/multisubunit Na+/H+ antiporter MnhD subunit
MKVTEIQSILPLLIFIIPIVFSIPTLTLGRKYRVFREGWALCGLIATLAVAVLIYPQIITNAELKALVWDQWFYLDGLSLLLQFVVSVMSILILLYSPKYLTREAPGGLISGAKLSLYYGLLLLSVGLMNWASASNSIIMLYVTLEGGTLSTVYLVAFDWQRRSLEAGFKYLLLISVGMIFSLLAGILLYCVSGDGGPLFLSKLGGKVSEFPRTIALVSCGLFIAGFGTKAGLIPFHAWLPDAHAEAPAPISVLLSGVVIKMGAYALARTVTVFAPHYREIVVFIVILSAVTMIVGIIMALAQDDLKRLLAYHSVSQTGYIVAGLGLGTYLGLYGGLFHLVNHAIFKGLLFFCSGALLYAAGSRSITGLSSIPKKIKITAFCFFVAGLALGGMPPLNGFMSKFTIFVALADSLLLWAAIISAIAAFLTTVCLLHAGYRIFWTKPIPELVPVLANPGPKEAKEVPPSMWGGMLFLAILCILFGVYPQVVYPLLDSAVNGILANSALP